MEKLFLIIKEALDVYMSIYIQQLMKYNIIVRTGVYWIYLKDTQIAYYKNGDKYDWYYRSNG